MQTRPRTERGARDSRPPPTATPSQPPAAGFPHPRELRPRHGGRALRTTVKDPPRPPCCQPPREGPPCPGPPPSLHFFSGGGERTLPPPPPGPTLLPCPRTEACGPSDPDPTQPSVFLRLRERWGHRHRVVQCVIFKLLSAWVSVCMKWNKLPTASPSPVYLHCPASARP